MTKICLLMIIACSAMAADPLSCRENIERNRDFTGQEFANTSEGTSDQDSVVSSDKTFPEDEKSYYVPKQILVWDFVEPVLRKFIETENSGKNSINQ